MRDDLAMLFNVIKQHQERKINLLIDLRNREFELKNLLNIHNADDINEILLAEDFIISEIDSSDFSIAEAIDEIKQLTGMDPLHTGAGNYIKSDPDIKQIGERFSTVSEIISEISKLRAENIGRMKSISSEASHASDELQRIDIVQRRFFRDLQSS